MHFHLLVKGNVDSVYVCWIFLVTHFLSFARVNGNAFRRNGLPQELHTFQLVILQKKCKLVIPEVLKDNTKMFSMLFLIIFGIDQDIISEHQNNLIKQA